MSLDHLAGRYGWIVDTNIILEPYRTASRQLRMKIETQSYTLPKGGRMTTPFSVVRCLANTISEQSMISILRSIVLRGRP